MGIFMRVQRYKKKRHHTYMCEKFQEIFLHFEEMITFAF